MMSRRVVTAIDSPRAHRAAAPALPLDRPMILVVDDDPDIRFMIERALMPICDVMTADSGLAAIRMLAEHSFALVVLDLHMPLVDGFTILKTLRKSQSNRETEVFVVTADVGPQTRANVMRLGASMAITKPFQPMMLRTLVEGRLKSIEDARRTAGPSR